MKISNSMPVLIAILKKTAKNLSHWETVDSMEKSRLKKRINTFFDRCTGCSLCRAACSLHMFGGFNPNKAMIRVESRWENLVHLPVVCRHCDNPLCLRVCPVSAITRDERTGAVVIDREKCIACGLCSRFCPLEMIHADPETGAAYKCDLCGGDPACVQMCPYGALEYATGDPAEKGES